MITALLGAGLFARARAAVSGPLGGALIIMVLAVVAVGALALGLAWLRNDAARDAGAAVQAQCDAARLAEDLAAERLKITALEAAAEARAASIRHMQSQAAIDAASIASLVQERGEAVDEAAKWEAAAGRRSCPVFRADDPWLRQGRATAAPGAVSGR